MMLHGWCERCRKFRRVRVRIPLLQRGVAVGVCADCEDERNRRDR